ncbi:MAG: arginine--tRNA ligase [Betaproteobacteria bacterium]|jgi:arginyl-tRNA synthetase|nr:arginine--tRNA ligase [Betaproteobacteria bacterium]HMW78239.1 arginine--tRNA ligase [Rhodocyclaceae bacterium]HNE44376.1 arginine--tRNA ligase [Rhodocyclaceae bacterium]HNL22283.1 arginine--tRNA ligase [Rhodocyclaceae bacterium]HNM82536.1 arginine--tRNA ligase [Rhodocyclaceae bacterium]
MAQDVKTQLADLLKRALASVAPAAAETPIHLERPRDPTHGDFATNLAMQLAKALKRNPREIAQQLVNELPPSPLVKAAEIAGAGFINFRLETGAKTAAVQAVLAAGADYGRSTLGGGRKIQVEFVSANPTGPLHVGHGRGAAYGASLSALLAFAGWDVTREYYVNDAGRQMDILGLSTWLRYLDLQGVTVAFPPNAYQGDYVREMAKQMVAAHGGQFVRSAEDVLACTPGLPPADRADDEAKNQRELHLDALIARAKDLLGPDWSYVHAHALSEQLADCRNDLEEFGVEFEVWFSEKALYDTGLVARCVDLLEKKGHLYVQDGAKWFKSTAFGDEKDRVVQRENGLYTYFASDIAYHLNKYERGFEEIINIWGADHHGYIPRVKGAVAALELDPARLHVALVQFAVLYRNGQKASMSTRSGEFVTLRELRQEVGNDACRFFYALRKSDQHLDFDLDLAKSQTNENPVYYVQYAHARICSVVAQWGGDLAELAQADLGRLENPRELVLTNKLAEFADIINTAAKDLAPHQIAFYLKDLAGEFHGWYNAERMLVDDPGLRDARVALAAAVRQVIRNGMALLGVSCPESM